MAEKYRVNLNPKEKELSYLLGVKIACKWVP